MIYGSKKGPTGRKRDEFTTYGFYRSGAKMIYMGDYGGVRSYGLSGEKQARRAIRKEAGGRAVKFATINQTKDKMRKTTWQQRKRA